MARYINDILQPNEKLVYSTTIHWMIYLPGVLLWVVAIAIYVVGANSTTPAWSLEKARNRLPSGASSPAAADPWRR